MYVGINVYVSSVDAREVKKIAQQVGRSVTRARRLMAREAYRATRSTMDYVSKEAPGTILPYQFTWNRVNDLSYTIEPYGMAHAGTPWATPYVDVVNILANTGAAPHYIFPSYKEALWWDDGWLSHPISMVGPPVTAIHPGVPVNDFLSRAVSRADRAGVYDRAVMNTVIQLEREIFA